MLAAQPKEYLTVLYDGPFSRRHGWVELTNHMRSHDKIPPCHWSTQPIRDAEIWVHDRLLVEPKPK